MGLEQSLPDRKALGKQRIEWKGDGGSMVYRTEGEAKMIKCLGSNVQMNWEQRALCGSVEVGEDRGESFSV